MKSMRLVRVAENKNGTFGVLIDVVGNEQIPFALTCEDKWRNNQRDVSCIPYGTYLCERVRSPKFGETFQIKKVPNRTHILFHKGNTEEDTHGCVLIGERFQYIGNKVAILQSREGFEEFLRRLDGHGEFEITIYMG